MNYYERHLGDYARDTAHLSMLEHGAYSLLLDRYYATEAPIPKDQVHRLARARSPDEVAAVDAVLAEFFELQGDAWVNSRAQREIAKYLESEPDRQAKKENDRERQRRFRDRRKFLFEQLRAMGIVPAYDTHTTELETMLKRATSEPVTRDVTQTYLDVTSDNTTTQPQTHTQEKDKKNSCPKPSVSDPATRLAKVTSEAIEAFNASPITKRNGGAVPNVSGVGMEKRRQQVKRCVMVARDICRLMFESEVITPEFWSAYWATVAEDPFASGRQPGSGAHANWVPDFEYLTRPDVMAKLFDKAAS